MNSAVRCFPLTSREYYILWYRLGTVNSCLIWYSNEEDGVFVDEGSFVPSFRDVNALLEYAGCRGVSVDTEGAVRLNLDVLERWLKEREDGLIELGRAARGIFSRMCRVLSAGGFDPDRKLTQKIYEKLFWGCNLQASPPAGKQYHPAWTKQEIMIMHDVLSSGGSVAGISSPTIIHTSARPSLPRKHPLETK